VQIESLAMEESSPGKELRVMTRQQVRGVDSWAIDEIGVPGVVLMENAGRGCVEVICRQLKGLERPKVCIFCGTGNNGGDGYVIARHLRNRGFEVVVALCGQPGKVRGDAKTNLDILERLGQRIELVDPAEGGTGRRVSELAGGADMIVDALFGTGLAGELRGGYAELIERINEQGCQVLAVDIPSGLDCDTGRPLGAAIRAKWTVTFVAVKRGFTAEGAQRYTGEVHVASIGVEPPALDAD